MFLFVNLICMGLSVMASGGSVRACPSTVVRACPSTVVRACPSTRQHATNHVSKRSIFTSLLFRGFLPAYASAGSLMQEDEEDSVIQTIEAASLSVVSIAIQDSRVLGSGKR